MRPASRAAAATHRKKKHKRKAQPAGPSLSVLGFGINRLFVANGKTVTSSVQCSEIVDGGGSPIGPPQQIIDDVFARATAIPSDTPVKVQDSLPEGLEELEFATLSPYGTWSAAFGNKIDFSNPPGSQKDVFSSLIASHFDEAGEYSQGRHRLPTTLTCPRR